MRVLEDTYAEESALNETQGQAESLLKLSLLPAVQGLQVLRWWVPISCPLMGHFRGLRCRELVPWRLLVWGCVPGDDTRNWQTCDSLPSQGHVLRPRSQGSRVSASYQQEDRLSFTKSHAFPSHQSCLIYSVRLEYMGRIFRVRQSL